MSDENTTPEGEEENKEGEVPESSGDEIQAGAEGIDEGASQDLEDEMAAAMGQVSASSPTGKLNDILSTIKAGDESLNKLKIQNLDFILDISLKVVVELGRTKVMIRDLLQLGQGSVLELNKVSGEPLEILVNGKLIARGEVVVINEKFGIRITDIVSPIERIETLKQ